MEVTDRRQGVATPSGVWSTRPKTQEQKDRAERLSGAVRTVTDLMAQMGASREEQAELIQLSSKQIQRARAGETTLLTREQLQVMGLMAVIAQAVGLSIGEAEMKGWIHRAQRREPFSGLSPFELMREGGILVMDQVRGVVQADTQGPMGS